MDEESLMSQIIREVYEKAGVSMRKAGIKQGKGIHTKAAHECVAQYVKKGTGSSEAWKRCMGGLGRDKAVKKSHWR
jgi:hypothetical protein